VKKFVAFSINVLLSSLILLAQAPKQKFNLDLIFREPLLYGCSPRNPVWSHNDSLLVFLWNDQGTTRYDLLLADIQANRVERLTDFARNQERPTISDLTWSPDNRQIFLLMEGDLYRFQIQPVRQLQRLTNTQSVESHLRLSPTKQHLAYLRDQQLIIYNLKQNSERVFNLGCSASADAPKLLTELYWSPTGKQIALGLPDTARYKFPLRIVDLETNQIQEIEFLNPQNKVGSIRDICWAPDEKQLALDILSADLTLRYLGLIDFAKSRLDTIYQERSQYPHFAPQKSRLFWFKGEPRLLFTSTQNNYHHLYLLNLTTRRWEALTRGKWQVEDYEIDEEHHTIYFTGNRDNPANLGVYALNLNNYQINCISYLDGSHQIHLAPGGTKIAEIFSNTLTPPELYWIETKPKYRMNRLTTSPNPLFKDYPIIQPVVKTIRNPWSGFDISYSCWMPAKNLASVKYPMIIVLNAQSVGGFSDNRWQPTILWQQWLSEQGNIVIQVDYTSLLLAQKLVREGLFPDILAIQISDLLAVIETEGQKDYVDINRVGVVGWGYGGYLATMALLKEARRFRAGAAIDVVFPESAEAYQHLDNFFQVISQTPDQFTTFNPLAFSNNLNAKYCFISGNRGCLPSIYTGAEFVRQLFAQGKDVDYRNYPWIDDVMDADETTADIFAKLSAFLRVNL